MGSAIDSRIKISDVGIPVLQTESEVRAVVHSSSAELYYGTQVTGHMFSLKESTTNKYFPIIIIKVRRGPIFNPSFLDASL